MAIREVRSGKLFAAGAALAALAGLLGGCAGAPSAKAVPSVSLDPLDVSTFAAKPCDLLREDRAARRHLAVPGSVTAGPNGPVCRWTATQPRVPLYTAGVAAHSGLNDVSTHRGDYEFVDQTSIAHYPAMHTRDRASGSDARCSTRVGVADDSQVIVTADDNGIAVRSSLDSCSQADTLATEILGQLLSGTG
jgi:hypothetical protein